MKKDYVHRPELLQCADELLVKHMHQSHLLTDITQRRRINVPKDLPDSFKIVRLFYQSMILEKILNIFEYGYYNFNGEDFVISLRIPHPKPTYPLYPYFSINKRDSSKQVLDLDQYTLSLTNQECILQNTIHKGY